MYTRDMSEEQEDAMWDAYEAELEAEVEAAFWESLEGVDENGEPFDWDAWETEAGID